MMGLPLDTLYHGMLVKAAPTIQAHGFEVPRSRINAVALLRHVVYCTTTLEKAMDYAKGNHAGGIILKLRADLGNCKTLVEGGAMIKICQHYSYDSVWAQQGANRRNMAENCIRINIVYAISGGLWRGGMLLRPDGR